MHTEAEAKTKWCPEARIIAFNTRLGDHSSVAGNGTSEKENVISRSTLCIASKCMHWRWAQKRNPDWTPGMTASSPFDPFRDKPMHIEDRTQGFCGLSGRP